MSPPVEVRFSCRRDAAVFLKTYTPGVRRCIVFVEGDDAKNFPSPEGVEVRRTPFRHCGNLNGIAFIRGWVGELRKLLDEGVEFVLKVDSDTAVVSPESFIPSPGLAFKGVPYSNNAGQFLGCCYGLRLSVAVPLAERRLAEGLTVPPMNAEDLWFSAAFEGFTDGLRHTDGWFRGDSERPAAFRNICNSRKTPI